MANQIKSLDEIAILFSDIVVSLTGLDNELVTVQYQRFGQPSTSYNINSAYVFAKQEQDNNNIFKNRIRIYNSADKTYTYRQQATRVISINTIFYGPDSRELSSLLNESIYFEGTKYTLYKNDLFLIPDRTYGPINLNEKHNGQWWQRSDIELRFYNPIIIEETVQTFESANINLEVEQ